MKNNLIVSSVGLMKFVFAGLLTFLFRLITPVLGLPNLTPLMATELAGSKAYGPWIAGLYGALNMIFIDAAVHQLGSWTVSGAICYGAVGVIGGYWLRNRKANVTNFVVASIVGTLLFDLVTGVLLAPMYGMSMWVALIGQIPFTAKHLTGNVLFACLAPAFYQYIMANLSLETKFGFKKEGMTVYS